MRLIDADELKEAVNAKKVVGRFNTILLIDSAPTVEERPKGEWINTRNYPKRWECSCCGMKSIHIYKFCPNCGAKMKGEEDNENN